MQFDDLPERVAGFNARIAAITGDADRVEIVGVTKTFGPSAVRAALAAGLNAVGENYAQELTEKHAVLAEEAQPQWHFIGQLQSNKVKQLAPFVDVFESVDRKSVIDELAKRAPSASMMLQVNLTNDPVRGGCTWEDIASLVERARSKELDVRGLMAVGVLRDPEDSRLLFRRLATVAKELELPELSIGMTDDFEVAIQEGSTMIRLGRALFGPRAG